MKHVPYILLAACLVSACDQAQTTHTLDWYKNHPTERAEKLSSCIANSDKTTDIECVNATQAQQQITSLNELDTQSSAPVNLNRTQLKNELNASATPTDTMDSPKDTPPDYPTAPEAPAPSNLPQPQNTPTPPEDPMINSQSADPQHLNHIDPKVTNVPSPYPHQDMPDNSGTLPPTSAATHEQQTASQTTSM